MGVHGRSSGEDGEVITVSSLRLDSVPGELQKHGANQLYETPGYNDPTMAVNYEIVKADFDQLQYWVNVLKGDYGKFDPYVALVHGPDYLDAPYAYAYSLTMRWAICRLTAPA